MAAPAAGGAGGEEDVGEVVGADGVGPGGRFGVAGAVAGRQVGGVGEGVGPLPFRRWAVVAEHDGTAQPAQVLAGVVQQVVVVAAEEAAGGEQHGGAAAADDVGGTGVDWRSGVNGAPLLTAALATLECELADVLPGGDHLIAVGRVTALTPAERLRENGPLLYFRRTYGRLGPSSPAPSAASAAAISSRSASIASARSRSEA
ncbi:Flavin reductase like protein [Streptomyces noursei ATCC 11455]|nr:Flavin reductase like protein [Streptomyces noursei ATCC 11455]